jgi:hypothetical protein
LSRPSGWMRATLGYNGHMGCRITAAEGQEDANLTAREWRALIYVPSNHGFSAPHLRPEEGEEAAERGVGAADAEEWRSALGKALSWPNSRANPGHGSPAGGLRRRRDGRGGSG